MVRTLTKMLSTEHARLARKASYWQKKYDLWKSHGAICPNLEISKIISNELLQEYMDKGWNDITKSYKSGKSQNNIVIESNDTFENKNKEEKELILEILGSIRKFIIKNTFKTIIKNKGVEKQNYIKTFGSKNITSDYDVTILGPNANDIMWEMFISFLSKYDDALPEAFDTNLYASPLYLGKTKDTGKDLKCKTSNRVPQIVYYDHFHFTLVPYTLKDLNMELSWACVKILTIRNLTPPILGKFMNNAAKIQKKMNQIEKDIKNDKTYMDISLQTNFHSLNSINQNTRNLIKKYYLQWKYQKSIQQFLYSDDLDEFNFINRGNYIILEGNQIPETNIFFYSNIVNYFASEAYYTSSAVNSIVIENQTGTKIDMTGRDLKIKIGVYLVSVIENLGDFIKHFNNEIKKKYFDNKINKKEIKLILIKYSKYLFRIFDSLSIAGDLESELIKNNIKKFVIPFRENYNLELAEKAEIFKYLFYDNEHQEEFLNIITCKILNKIKILMKKIVV